MPHGGLLLQGALSPSLGPEISVSVNGIVYAPGLVSEMFGQWGMVLGSIEAVDEPMRCKVWHQSISSRLIPVH